MIEQINMKKILLIFSAPLLMGACARQESVTVAVSNPIGLDREGELVEVSMAEISDRLRLPDTSQVVITDEESREVPYQITHDDLLVFPASVKGESTATYTIAVGTPHPVEVTACGRVYPERLDDLSWENDRTGFRAYGPALQARGERGFGYDIWTKSVPEPVLEERYDGELNHGISYHVDHGNGMDCYAVGPTLGGGTAALFPDSTIVYPYCYKECEVLDNGPLRFTARLVFHPLTVKGDSGVVETRIISLDKGSQLNKTVVTYDNLSETTPVAAGIVLHREHPDGYAFNASAGYIAYADSTQSTTAGNGVIYVGAVFPDNVETTVQLFPEAEQKDRNGALGHVLGVSSYTPGSEYVYYWGSGWSKYGFAADTDWIQYLKEYARKVRHPLTVEVR